MRLILGSVLSLLLAGTALAGSPETVTAQVNGMVCDFCVRSLEAVIGGREEVAAVNVDLDAKAVTIAMKPGQSLDDETVTTLIIESGFDVVALARTAEVP